MYETLKDFILSILKVPPEPDDPMGNVKSLKVFRASYNYFRYRYYIWLIKNVIGLFGSLALAGVVCSGIFISTTRTFGTVLALFVTLLIGFVVLFFYLGQMFVSYTLLRLDYEMRWYKISDRSLRIREGVVQVREMTMSFANIQNISVQQGPLQRLFKIADLKVESAGGGGGLSGEQGNVASAGMHMAFFKGVDNANEICELMKERLRRLRGAGLGDHDDGDETKGAVSCMETAEQLLEAIREESRLFRLQVEALAVDTEPPGSNFAV